MSRLEFAPKLEEIKITDIKEGLAVFTPKPEKAVSFAALVQSLKRAGYTLDRAEITLVGKLIQEGETWQLVTEPSKQNFTLESAATKELARSISSGAQVEVSGHWKTEGVGTSAREVITPQTIKAVDEKSASKEQSLDFVSSPEGHRVYFISARYERKDKPPVYFTAPALVEGSAVGEVAQPLAPIRTTSPGLTVYQGGAFVPRFHYIRQALGGLHVNRLVLDLSASYTPTPRVQLEAETFIARTSFRDGAFSGADTGFGNLTLWSKYRFFRRVKKYGDRQAAARFGLELPTGKKGAPSNEEVNAPEFVRQQLTPINGGLTPHFDVAFSQAGGRVIFGGNAEGIIRSERDGYRTGHELRVNTDLEYVLLPRQYRVPGKELFAILETNFVQRGRGRVNGSVVEGSKATEFYCSPGLQYAAAPRFVIEGSIQLPVIQNTGPLVLRTNMNLLLGVKYLF